MPLIVESIVTTMDADGRINFAPMGVEWSTEMVRIKPFRETVTFRNLAASGEAVVNLTDDVFTFVQAALGDPQFPSFPAAHIRGAVLADACSYLEVRAYDRDLSGERGRFDCAILGQGHLREFVGFNRARAAVLEATILATRLQFRGPAAIAADLERFQVIVDKTGGPREHEAFAFVLDYIRRWDAEHSR